MILLSVNPPYAGLLVDGIKTVEWRKKPLPTWPPVRWPQKPKVLDPLHVFIYETAHNGGCGMVIGDVEMNATFVFDDFDDIPAEFIERGYYDEYLLRWCIQRDGQIYASVISKSKRFNYPVQLSELGVKRPPQSWYFL